MAHRIENSASIQEDLQQRLGDSWRTEIPFPPGGTAAENTSSTRETEKPSDGSNHSSPSKTCGEVSQSRSHHYSSWESQIVLRGRTELASSCAQSCRCRCHKRYSIMSPAITSQYSGLIGLQWANIRLWQPSCNVPRCRRNANSQITFQYTFPTRLFAAMISAWYSGTTLQGPKGSLSCVPVALSETFLFASQGNVEKLKSSYTQHVASINQVDPITGWNALMVSIKQLPTQSEA